MATFTFTVNGAPRECEVDEDKPLLWVLRENLGLTGTKYGCGIAMCGACTVLIEDDQDAKEQTSNEQAGKGRRPRKTARSCVARAQDAQAWRITTIEGLSEAQEKLVQQAWIEQDVPQCGYCQSGQIMTTVALLNVLQHENRELHDDDIDAALAGNLCRCGTYVRIRAAVKAAAKAMAINVRAER